MGQKVRKIKWMMNTMVKKKRKLKNREIHQLSWEEE
jgi:hypothetical protein